jgi:hypothetical protein
MDLCKKRGTNGGMRLQGNTERTRKKQGCWHPTGDIPLDSLDHLIQVAPHISYGDELHI